MPCPYCEPWGLRCNPVEERPGVWRCGRSGVTFVEKPDAIYELMAGYVRDVAAEQDQDDPQVDANHVGAALGLIRELSPDEDDVDILVDQIDRCEEVTGGH